MKGRWQTDTSRVIWHGAGRKTARWKWRGTEKYYYTGESLQIRLWLIPVLSEMVANRRNTANKGKYCHLVYCETNSEHSAAGFLAGKPKPSNKHEGNEVQGIGNSNLVFRANLHRRRTPKWQEKSPKTWEYLQLLQREHKKKKNQTEEDKKWIIWTPEDRRHLASTQDPGNSTAWRWRCHGLWTLCCSRSWSADHTL